MLEKFKRVIVAQVATKALAPLRKRNAMKSWKTTAAGIASILSVIAKVIGNDFQVGAEDVALVTGAVGLMTAKDYNATHTKP